MARPIKKGLDYFPLNIDLFDHDKTKLAEDILDPSGESPHLRLLVDKMIIRLFASVFAKGYYLEWNEEVGREINSKIGNGMTYPLLKRFLACFLKAGFFHEETFNKYSILTSKGIQEQWYVASKLARRTDISVEKKYKLFDETNISSRRNKKKDNSIGKKSKSKHKKKLSPAKTIVSSGRNHINVVVSSGRNLLYEVITLQKWQKRGFPPEETPQLVHASIQKPEFSFLLLYNNKSIGNILYYNTYSSRKQFPPEETIVNSGINQQKDGFLHEETNLGGAFIPEETANNGTKKHQIRIDPNSMQLYKLDDCSWNYINNEIFEMTRHQHVANFGVDWDIGTMEKWAKAFNRQKISDGTMEMPMNGNLGWCRNFKNWVPKIDNFRGIDPDTLFTNKDIKEKQNGNQRTRSQSKPADNSPAVPSYGGVKGNSMQQLLSRKRRTGGTESPPQGEAGVSGDV